MTSIPVSCLEKVLNISSVLQRLGKMRRWEIETLALGCFGGGFGTLTFFSKLLPPKVGGRAEW